MPQQQLLQPDKGDNADAVIEKAYKRIKIEGVTGVFNL
jgi:hypothetical protein